MKHLKVLSACIIGILLLASGSTPVDGSSANYAPTSTGGNRPLYSGTSASLIPWVEDPDMWASFTFQILSQPASGAAGVVGNQLQYTPAGSFTGTDNFTYQVLDQGGNTISGSEAVRVYSSGSLSSCKQNSTVYSSGVNNGQLESAPFTQPCTFYSISNTRVTDTGAPVTMDYLINWPSPGAAPKAVVVLIGGGSLNMGFTGNTTTGVLNTGGTNTLDRTAQLFADAGYLTIAINRPSDQPPAGSTDNTADADQYRISVNHAVDILTILKHINTENLDVFIAGTSRGTISAVALNLIASGISLSSSLTSDPNSAHVYIGKPGVSNLQPSFVSRPVHVLWNTDDLCSLSNPANSQALYNSLAAYTTAAYSTASGGVRVTVAGGIYNVSASDANDVCGDFDYHGYCGIETTAVAYITNWLDAQVSSLSGNKRPEAAFTTITAAGAPVSIDLSTLTIDQAGYTMSYALSHTITSLGGSVSISGSTATYTPPANAGSMTDYFVYVVSDGRGGVNAAVVTVQNGAYQLAAASNGSGNGTLTSSSAGIICGGGACSGISTVASTVVITATATAGSSFAGWSGCDTVNGNNCSVTMNSAKSVTATFNAVAATCIYSISASSVTLSSGANTGSVNVTASSNSCTWSATSNGSWITIISGVSGTGNGTVSYSVSAYTGSSSRTATLTIAGQTFTVIQAGSTTSATGTITEFRVPTANSSPWDILAGPDGNLWFTEYAGNKIGRITPAGVITEFTVPTASSLPESIHEGSDGNLWFTEYASNKIGRITTAGVITEFTVPTPVSGLDGITLGPDGNLWFTEYGGNKIGRITTAGVITEFSIPTSFGDPSGITSGPDNNLWFTESGGNQIGRITTAGIITEFTVPTVGSGLTGITAGPDGNLWFTEYTGNKIGQLLLSTVPSSGSWSLSVSTTGTGSGTVTSSPRGSVAAPSAQILTPAAQA